MTRQRSERRTALGAARLVTAAAVWTVVTCRALGQEIRVEADAVARAARLCQEIGRRWTADNASARRLASSWQVQDRPGGLLVMVDSETGACSALVDLSLSDEVYRRKAAVPRSLQSHAEAWAAGERVLRHAGQWDAEWQRGELRPLADMPAATNAKDAHSDRYTLEWLKKAPGYEGSYGRATMTIDLVTGRPVGFTVNVLQFEPPARTLPRREALEAVRRHWNAEFDRLVDAGYGGEANLWFKWPAEPEARMVLQVRDDGSACYGSDYGERMANEGKARLCWVFGNEGTEIAIDAENGQPFSGGVSKASVDAAKRNPPRDPFLNRKAGPLDDLPPAWPFVASLGRHRRPCSRLVALRALSPQTPLARSRA